jgi:Tol biopolymer transport system component
MLAAGLLIVVVAGAAAVLVAVGRARSAERAAAALAARPLAPPLEPRPLTSEIGLFWSPRLSPDARRLVYVRRTEDSADLILREIADGRETPLRASPANEYSPAWSPDGRAVAFLREEPGEASSLIVIELDSGRERTVARVTAPPFGQAHLTPPHVDWSPDGAHVVVPDRSADGAPYRLVLVDVATGNRTIVTNPPGHDWGDTSARFSPDGGRLVISRHASATSRELLIQDLDPHGRPAGSPRRLSAGDGTPAQEPAWTPDGHHVVFASGFDSRLFVASAASAAPARRLPYTAPRVRMPDVRAGADGRWSFAFVLNDHDVDIVRMPLTREGGVPRAVPGAWRAVARSVGIDARPALSPDGRQMAFTSDRTGSLQIWIADLQTGGVRQLTRLPATPLGHLHWSPDGSRIAFTTTLANERGRDLFTARVSDGAVEPIVQREMDDKWQWWSLDGRFLHFVGGPDGAARVWRVPAGGGEPAVLYEHDVGALRERPGGGYILVDDGFSELPASLEGPPGRLTDIEPYDSTSFDVTPGGIYFVTGDRRLLHYAFDARTVTTVADLPSPVRAGVVVSPDERHAFVPLAEERIRVMLVDDLRPALGVTEPE